jgi:hypothetical protein
VVALDMPWGDAVAAAHHLAHGERAIPVLVLGDYFRNGSPNGFSHLPLEVDATDIRDAVADMLAVPHDVAV